MRSRHIIGILSLSAIVIALTSYFILDMRREIRNLKIERHALLLHLNNERMVFYYEREKIGKSIPVEDIYSFIIGNLGSFFDEPQHKLLPEITVIYSLLALNDDQKDNLMVLINNKFRDKATADEIYDIARLYSAISRDKDISQAIEAMAVSDSDALRNISLEYHFIRFANDSKKTDKRVFLDYLNDKNRTIQAHGYFYYASSAKYEESWDQKALEGISKLPVFTATFEKSAIIQCLSMIRCKEPEYVRQAIAYVRQYQNDPDKEIAQRALDTEERLKNYIVKIEILRDEVESKDGEISDTPE